MQSGFIAALVVQMKVMATVNSVEENWNIYFLQLPETTSDNKNSKEYKFKNLFVKITIF